MKLFEVDIPVENIEKPKKKKRPFYEPGWYKNLSNADYHGSFGVSSTKLKTLVEKTAMHYKWEQSLPFNQTDNMALGTAVHSLVFEPENFDNDIYVMPDCDTRTKKGKMIRQNIASLQLDKTVITESQYESARRMADNVLTQKYAKNLLDDTVNESSIYWWYDRTRS
jgi:exodeoxyribonuclease VIII